MADTFVYLTRNVVLTSNIINSKVDPLLAVSVLCCLTWQNYGNEDRGASQ